MRRMDLRWCALGLFLFGVGCDQFEGGGPGVGAACGPDGSCAPGLTCVNDVCALPGGDAPLPTDAGDAVAQPDNGRPGPDTGGPCVPNCAGLECGPNGCGGLCGSCPNGETCQAGSCQPGRCVADCTNKECGSNGCGGLCGSCPADEHCNAAFQCEAGTCTPDCTNRECGDNGCGGTCGTCAADERCNAGGQCQPGGCEPNCAGRACGSDGCSGACGTCGSGERCVDGQCVAGTCGETPLTPSGSLQTDVTGVQFDGAAVTVTHKQDVDAWEDGCFVSFSVDLTRGTGCTLHLEAEGSATGNGGLAVTYATFSADSQCPGFTDDDEGQYLGQGGLTQAEIVPGIPRVPDENAAYSCFNTTFQVHLAGVLHEDYGGRTLEIAPSTLTIAGDFVSNGSTTARCPCEAQCAGKDCGDDGCGGVCGTCSGVAECIDGRCVEPCAPNCAGKQCGDDGCDGDCGTCTPPDVCNAAGQCVPDCTPACAGKECGPDGCGGTCGTCTAPETCQAGQCVGPQTCDQNGFTAAGGQFCEYAEDTQNSVYFYRTYTGTSGTFSSLGVELWVSLSGPDGPGTYTIDDSNYNACSLCVITMNGCTQTTEGVRCAKAFLAQSGGLRIDALDGVGGSFQGKLTNVELIEVTIDSSTWTSTPVPNGQDWCISSFDIDADITQAQ